jgi:hypothetical protein
MKQLWMAAAMVLLFACKVEKTGKDTYRVVTPTPEAKAAGERAKVEAQKAGREIKQGVKDLGQKIETTTIKVETPKKTTSIHH